MSQEDIEMAGAGWSVDKTRNMVSVQSQANVQSELYSVSLNLSGFEDVARELYWAMRSATLMQENFREKGTHV